MQKNLIYGNNPSDKEQLIEVDVNGYPIISDTSGMATILGGKTDAPASVSLDEDGTARSNISLLKAAKNLLIDISGFASDIKGLIGVSTDAPFVGAEDGTARSIVTLLKGVKNAVYGLYGCIVASVSLTCGFNNYSTTPVELTLSTAGVYAANDCLGGALVEIPSMALANGRGGIIDMVRLSLDEKSKTPRIRIHLFNANNPTLATDNSNWKELYADGSKRVGYIDMVAMSTAADTANSDCSRSQEATSKLPLRYNCAAGSTSLWAGFEALDAVTITAGKKLSIVVKGEKS